VTGLRLEARGAGSGARVLEPPASNSPVPPAPYGAHVVCLACGRISNARLCGDCSERLRPVPDQLLAGGLRVRSAFLHRGPARSLVHNLKYRGIEPAGHLLAEAMSELIPPGSTLIPIPRVVWREVRYGIDPAATLASRLAVMTGGRRRDLLAPPLLGASQAKASRDSRRPPMFKARKTPKEHVVIVDDVVTTGGTAFEAWRALGFGPALVVTATSAGGRLSGHRERAQSTRPLHLDL
jgi:predicted amidophosphoribosyltransferase